MFKLFIHFDLVFYQISYKARVLKIVHSLFSWTI